MRETEVFVTVRLTFAFHLSRLNVDQMARNCFQCHSTLTQRLRGSVFLISQANVKELCKYYSESSGCLDVYVCISLYVYISTLILSTKVFHSGINLIERK